MGAIEVTGGCFSAADQAGAARPMSAGVQPLETGGAIGNGKVFGRAPALRPNDFQSVIAQHAIGPSRAA